MVHINRPCSSRSSVSLHIEKLGQSVSKSQVMTTDTFAMMTSTLRASRLAVNNFSLATFTLVVRALVNIGVSALRSRISPLINRFFFVPSDNNLAANQIAPGEFAMVACRCICAAPLLRDPRIISSMFSLFSKSARRFVESLGRL